MLQNKTYYQSDFIPRVERKKILLNQLREIVYKKGIKISNIKMIERRLKGIINYLIKYTDIKNLSEVKREHFFGYLKYSVEDSYLKLSLKELKSEINLLQLILESYTKEEATIDMSVQNFNLWTQLLPVKRSRE